MNEEGKIVVLTTKKGKTNPSQKRSTKYFLNADKKFSTISCVLSSAQFCANSAQQCTKFGTAMLRIRRSDVSSLAHQHGKASCDALLANGGVTH